MKCPHTEKGMAALRWLWFNNAKFQKQCGDLMDVYLGNKPVVGEKVVEVPQKISSKKPTKRYFP